MVFIGRITTGVIMLLAMIWSTQGDQFGTIFEAINKIPMTFAPAVTTVFVLGVLWKRGTKQAAMTTLSRYPRGVLYFLADLPKVGATRPGSASARGVCRARHRSRCGGLGIPFMLVGPLLAAVCVGLYVLTSLATPAMDSREVAAVCWDHPLAFLRGRIDGASYPRVVSLVLLGVVGSLDYWLR